MQWEDILQGLCLAAMQVRSVIIDTEQRRHVEPILTKRGAGCGVVSDLQRIGDVKGPHILEIFNSEGIASERKELVGWRCGDRRRRRESRDAGVQGRTVLGSGGGIIAVEDLALRPLGSPVAGRAICLKHGGTGRQIAELWLIQRPHGKDPQGLRVEGVAASLGDAMVVDGRVRGRRGSHRETLPRGENIAGETAAPLRGTGVVVELRVAAAYGTPVEQSLV